MDYQLSIRIPFTAMDDVAARDLASQVLANGNNVLVDWIRDPKTVVKLQRVTANTTPVGVPLVTNGEKQ
jgi:hypothetical protein